MSLSTYPAVRGGRHRGCPNATSPRRWWRRGLVGADQRAGGTRVGLERDVVVRRCRDGRGDGGGLRGAAEVGRVDRDVGARREPAAGLTAAAVVVVAAAQELDGVGDDLDLGAVLARLLVLPLRPLEAAVARDRTALGQVPRGVLALRAPDRDVEVVGLVLPVTGRVVLATGVDGDAQLADGRAAGQ